MLKESALVLGALTLILSGCGGDDDTATPSDDAVVEITMKDSRFDPTKVEVEAGDEVTFRFTNDGELDHEAFVGTESEQNAHEDEMRSSDEDTSDTSHSEGHSGMANDSERDITVVPGDSGDLHYTFEEPGTVLIGCHEPGHYRGGMKATVTVT